MHPKSEHCVKVLYLCINYYNRFKCKLGFKVWMVFSIYWVFVHSHSNNYPTLWQTPGTKSLHCPYLLKIAAVCYVIVSVQQTLTSYISAHVCDVFIPRNHTKTIVYGWLGNTIECKTYRLESCERITAAYICEWCSISTMYNFNLSFE